MHNTGHMMNSMWGMGGWFGPLTNIVLWMLVGAGIFYLYQEASDASKSQEDKSGTEE